MLCTPLAATFAGILSLNASLAGIGLSGESPNSWQQILCVKDAGGCREMRDGGTVSDENLLQYDQACRARTGYSGAPITFAQLGEGCKASLGWLETNRETIRGIRQEAKLNDAEALARIFEDPRIIGGAALAARLDSLLDSLEDSTAKGARTGIEFSDEGFRGTRERDGQGFKDPHPQSRNQVGHFMTAVGLGWDPGVVRKTNMGIPIRKLLDADDSMSDLDVSLHLIVGHEKAPDPDENDGLLQKYSGFKKQFHSPTNEELRTFETAESALGAGKKIDMDSASIVLKHISINPDWNGNSIQDLRLSLAGWHLGRLIRSGQFKSGAEVADWIRVNLKE